MSRRDEPPLPRAGRLPDLLCAALVVAALVFYSIYTQRYIGASDWYGYHQEALLLTQGRVALPSTLPAAEYPAQAPLGYNLVGERFLPQYTPGFPVLLALGRLVGLEFYVPPLVGALSVLLLYRIVRRRSGAWIALLFAAAWTLMPIVIWGGTQLMSDLAAATMLMLVYDLCADRRAALAGAAMVFAVAVRPTNGLFLILVPFLLRERRERLAFALGAALPALVYGLYNLAAFGAPWRTGYIDIRGDLVPAFALANLRFYLREISAEMGAATVLLAVVGIVKARRDTGVFVAWFSSIVGFYLFWRYPGTDTTWWWLRFVLPALPPVLVLASDGLGRLAPRNAGAKARGLRQGLVALTAALLLVGGVRSVQFCRKNAMLKPTKAIEYRDTVLETERLVPPGTWLGSVEFSGSTLLYTRLHSFLSVHAGSERLVSHLMSAGEPVYLLVEPWNRDNLQVKDLLTRYHAEQRHVFDFWGGVILYRLAPSEGKSPGGAR